MKFKSLVTRFIQTHTSRYKQSNRKVNDIKYIVMHFTAVDGDSDEAEARNFSRPGSKSSAHFFVDDNSITQTVDIKDIAWHCGGSVYNDVAKTGGAKLHNICKNSNSIGIEMCDTNRNGNYDITDKTRNNAIKLVSALMDDYNIDINHIVRHFDVTGKYCPRYYCPPYGSNDEWNKFKQDILNSKATSNKNNTTTNKLYRVRKSWSDTKSQIGAYSVLDNAIKACKEGYSVFDWNGNVVYSKTTTVSKEYKVKVTASALNYRKGPGTNYGVNGTITDRGIYTIVEESNGWGKLKSGAGWIKLKYTSRI